MIHDENEGPIYMKNRNTAWDWLAPNYIGINFHDHFAVYYTEGLASLVKKKQLKIDRFSDHQLLQHQPPPRCEIFHYWDNNSRGEAFLTSVFRGAWICPMGITTCPPGSDVYLLWLPKPISVGIPTSNKLKCAFPGKKCLLKWKTHHTIFVFLSMTLAACTTT